MKFRTILLPAFLLLFTLNLDGLAQQQKKCSAGSCCEKAVLKTPATVSKGYYAIGDNAQKLTRKQMASSCKPNINNENLAVQPAENKGFFSIGKPNSKKQSKSSYAIACSNKPKTSDKGYYAIGGKTNDTQAIDLCCACCS